MVHYIDGKDVMVSRSQSNVSIQATITLTHGTVTDLGMDPFDLRLSVRRGAHIHAIVSSSHKVGLVGLSVACICCRCFGPHHLRHTHVSNGRPG